MDEAGGVYPSNEYGRYCVPEGLEDRPAARAVIAGRAYEPDTLRFMRQHEVVTSTSCATCARREQSRRMPAKTAKPRRRGGGRLRLHRAEGKYVSE